MSAWLDHVKATMKLNKGKPLKVVLKLAKKTYKKGKHAVKRTKSVVKYAVTGKKTRKHRTHKHRTRKHKKTAHKRRR